MKDKNDKHASNQASPRRRVCPPARPPAIDPPLSQVRFIWPAWLARLWAICELELSTCLDFTCTEWRSHTLWVLRLPDLDQNQTCPVSGWPLPLSFSFVDTTQTVCLSSTLEFRGSQRHSRDGWGRYPGRYKALGTRTEPNQKRAKDGNGLGLAEGTDGQRHGRQQKRDSKKP